MDEIVFETDRLVIRKFLGTDWSDLYEYLSLPETYLFEPGSPVTVDQAKAMAEERSKGENFLAVVLKSENKMVGHLYFASTAPEEFRTWELGYIFNPKYQNRGYCTEASERMIEYGFLRLRAHRINAYCNPVNRPSWRVLEKIGMRREGTFRKRAFFRKDEAGNPIWHDCYAYGIIEDDFGG